MTLLALLACGLAWGQQTLTGGGFEMRRHYMGPAAESSMQVFGDTISLRSFYSGFASTSYPLSEPAGRRLMPPPWGFGLYSFLATNRIPSPGDAHAITVSQLAVVEDYDFFFNPDPLANPMRADPAVIAQANARLIQGAGPQAVLVPQSVVELNLMLEFGGFQSALAREARLNLGYRDADGDGRVDGTNIRAKTLAVYTLDEARGTWVKLTSAVDVAGRTVGANLPRLSVYALIGVADTEVNSVHAFPVPWAPNSGDPADGTLGGGITFNNVPSEGSIQIYTVSGQRVRTLSIPPGLFPAELKWDVRTEGGQPVTSGVYVWRIESGRNSKTGKLMVIR